MKSIWSRTRDFFSVVSKDTHLWVFGVLVGAVILSASFYLEPFNKDFFSDIIMSPFFEKCENEKLRLSTTALRSHLFIENINILLF